MKLYCSATSPFARKVLVLLRESGQLGDVEKVLAAGTPVNAGTMPVAKNPLGKIPVLEPDEGPALFDSRVICQFLDARVKGGFYPDPPQRWATLTLEAMADGMVDAAILMVYETRLRSESQIMQGWVDGQWAKVARALDTLEDAWADRLDGPLDMGQIALGCALSYLDFRHNDRNWRKDHARLSAWEAKFATRESMKATAPVE